MKKYNARYLLLAVFIIGLGIPVSGFAEETVNFDPGMIRIPERTAEPEIVSATLVLMATDCGHIESSSWILQHDGINLRIGPAFIEELVSATFNKEMTRLTIIKIFHASDGNEYYSYATKEIYQVGIGIFQKVETIRGKIIMEITIPQHIEWEK